MVGRIGTMAIAALIVATAPARAAEIDAMITTAMGSAIEQLAPAFEGASGHTLRIVYGPSGGLASKADHSLFMELHSRRSAEHHLFCASPPVDQFRANT